MSNVRTVANYKSAYRAYSRFTGLSADQLIDEAFEDARRDPRQKSDIVLHRLKDFYWWLKKDYEVLSKGKGPRVVIRKGLSDKLADFWVNGVRSFYGTFDINVRMVRKNALPKPVVQHKRLKLNAAQVKILLDNTRSLRDRAVILTLFQGGMDVSTLCTIKYGMFRDEHPLKLELQRPKTGVSYYTFLGFDSVEAIKAYIKDMVSRGLEFSPNMPLFRMERGKGNPAKPKILQDMLKDVAVRSGFVDPETSGRDFNPVGTHALRESFGGIMINSGVPDTIVDFWLGHDIGEMAKAYKQPQYESLRQMYLDREKLLSVSQAVVVGNDTERRIKKLEEENKAMREELKKAQKFIDDATQQLNENTGLIKEFAKRQKP
jgi:integrase/recombinase XerD